MSDQHPPGSLSPDIIEQTTETGKPQTLGEQFVAHHFHSHPDMPEEMPINIQRMMEKGYKEGQTETAREQATRTAKMLWQAMRSGTAELSMPNSSWNEWAKALTAIANGAEADLAGGTGGGPEMEVIHIFRTAAIIYGLSIMNDPILEARVQQPVEKVLNEQKDYLDSGVEAIEEYDKIAKTAKSKEGESTEDRNTRRAQGWELQEEIVKEAQQLDKDPQLTPQTFIDKCKQWEELTGAPYWISAAMVINRRIKDEKQNNQVRDLIVKSLTPAQLLIFETYEMEGYETDLRDYTVNSNSFLDSKGKLGHKINLLTKEMKDRTKF